MFGKFFLKKLKYRKKPKNLLNVDIHSHLIPAIDDGASTFEKSLNLIKAMSELGYKHLYITPHIMKDVYNNSSKTIMDSFNLLKNTLSNEKIDIKISIGAEYYLDDGFIERLNSKDILALDNKYLLFETSYHSEPQNLLEIIYEVKANGYIPLLAHPERYRYINYKGGFYKKLKENGLYFQVNINSFCGFYGKDARKKAIFLSKNGFIDFLGSDLHKKKQLLFLEKTLKSQLFYDIFKKNKILNNQLGKGLIC